MEKKKTLTDIYIKPDIHGYSVLSFDQRQEIIPKGEKETLKFLTELKKLKTEGFKNEPIHVQVEDTIYIKEISIKNLNNYTRAYVIGKLKFKADTKISFKDLEKGINNLNATQNFSAIVYSFREIREGESELILDLKESKNNSFFAFWIAL